MNRLIEMMERVKEQIAEYRKIQKTVEQLSKLTDKELRDIGIGRNDIYEIARGNTSVYRRVV
jgi:uncharacterized protein YjiS (DUF1127 family)